MIYPNLKIKLSRRVSPPYFNIHVRVGDTYFWLHKALIFIWKTRKWRLIEENPDYATYLVDGYKIKLSRARNPAFSSPAYIQSLFRHFFDWKNEYKPPFSLAGKTVLDAGCGVGETALLFFTMGAKRVICIDINPEACRVLRENADMNGWDVEIINEPFQLKHLLIDWDFCKMDIEGGESCLLSLDRLPNKPIVMETHGAQLTRELSEKFHLNSFKIMHHDKVYDSLHPWAVHQNGEESHAMMRNY